MFQTDTILTICSCQGPRLVHLEFLTNFETNCQWSIAERSKHNAKQRHKCHLYIRLHHLAISLGAKRKVWNGLNMLEITEDYMKLTWSDMKQHEISFHPPKKQGSTWVPPVTWCNTWVPPALFQAFSGLGAPLSTNQWIWSFKFVPSVPVLLGDSTAVKSSRVLVARTLTSDTK